LCCNKAVYIRPDHPVALVFDCDTAAIREVPPPFKLPRYGVPGSFAASGRRSGERALFSIIGHCMRFNTGCALSWGWPSFRPSPISAQTCATGFRNSNCARDTTRDPDSCHHSAARGAQARIRPVGLRLNVWQKGRAITDRNIVMTQGKSKNLTMSGCVRLDLGEPSRLCSVWFR